MSSVRTSLTTPVLTLTRGLPGSGKTTWAKTQTYAARVNRDELRAMMRADWPHGDPRWEHLCTFAQHAQIHALLRAGVDVICDDTNLDPRTVTALKALARNAGALVGLKDFTHVPVALCIARDAARPNPVGADVIERMWANYIWIDESPLAGGGAR